MSQRLCQDQCRKTGRLRSAVSRFRPSLPGAPCLLSTASCLLFAAFLAGMCRPTWGAEEPLSLEEAVNIALQNNPRLGAGEARVGQAEARVGSARAQRGFRLNIVSTSIRQGPEISFPGAGSIVPTFRFQHSLELQRNIYDGGRRSAQQRIAEIGVGIARHALAQTKDDIALEARAAYFEVLRARRLREVGKEVLEAVEEHLRVTEARFRAGVTARFDVLRSEAEVEDARQILIDDESAVELTEAQFNTVLGRPINTPVHLESVEDAPTVNVTLSEAIETAYQHRPELLTLPQQVALARQDVRVARSGWRPNLDFFYNYNRVTATAFQSNFSFAYVAIVTLPLFDAGLARAQVAEAKQGLEETQETNESIRQRVELEVKQAYLNLVRARQRRVTAQKEIVSARESLRVAQVRYNAGVGTNLEVTDARVAWTRAEWNQVNALYDYHIALAQLEHGMGASVEEMRTAQR